jgi:hypothetical protein
MISFRETQDAVERVAQMLKSADDMQSVVDHTLTNLAEFRSMIEYSRTRQFKQAEDVLGYLDKVVVPQLNGIHDALQTGSQPHLKNLRSANEQCHRLAVRLEMLTEGLDGDLLP